MTRQQQDVVVGESDEAERIGPDGATETVSLDDLRPGDVVLVRSGGRVPADGAILDARKSDASTVIHVETDPFVGAPDSGSWWDVPVPEVSALESTRAARAVYERHKVTQRPFLTPSD